MTNNNKAKKTTKKLIELYNQYAIGIQENNRNMQGVHLKTNDGYVYVRNMARGVLSGNLVLCLATIDLNVDLQNKGILTALIKHIENNPFSFSEIEIENVHEQFLVDSLVKKDFVKINSDYSLPVTLTKKI